MAIDTLAAREARPPAQPPPAPQPPARRSRVKLALLACGLIAAAAAALAVIPRAGASRPIDPSLTHTLARGELVVTVTEQGTLESANNTEIKCTVRGDNTITWVVESGTKVQPGDQLVTLETLLIEEEINERKKFAHLARSGAERAKADMNKSRIAIMEYLEGRFVTSLTGLLKEWAVAKSNLLSTETLSSYTKMMAKSEYDGELIVEKREFDVAQAKLKLALIEKKIDVHNQFTLHEQLATLTGALNAAEAKYEAEKERAYADEQRLKRAEEELVNCEVYAPTSGMVIYPRGREWEETPDIEEGATVHKDQVLLLMPDLTKMQVKVGIHESTVDRVKEGMPAIVTLPGKSLEATISSVASVAKPAGWWSGNVVKYDTIVELPPSIPGLKPGMSVEVEVVLARHADVLKIPTSAVIETARGFACWVSADGQPQRRTLQLGDSNEMFIVVEAGVAEGDQVILDPLANVKEAQQEAESALADEADAQPVADRATKENR